MKATRVVYYKCSRGLQAEFAKYLQRYTTFGVSAKASRFDRVIKKSRAHRNRYRTMIARLYCNAVYTVLDYIILCVSYYIMYYYYYYYQFSGISVRVYNNIMAE